MSPGQSRRAESHVLRTEPDHASQTQLPFSNKPTHSGRRAGAARVNRKELKVVERDPDDDKFIECAVAGKAKYLVSGDLDLLSLGGYGSVKIVSSSRLLELIGSSKDGPT